MIRGILLTSMNFRFLVIILAGIVVFAGISQAGQMPVDVLPEFSPPYVEIQTEALGLSAKEVEQMLTVPLEQDLLAGVAWLDVIRSESVPGLSSILVYFEPGTDLYRARQMVSERLAQSAVGLPHVSKPPTMIQPLSSSSRFMVVGLSSKELSLIEMSVLARWTIAPRLMGVPGVAHVAIWGQRERQLQVLVNPERLRAYEVSLDQVVETTGNALWVSSLSFLEASSPGTGGFIDTPNQRLNVWHILPISSPEDLAKVPVEGADDLLLGDIAEVVEDHQPLIGDAVINDQPSLLLVIEKLPGVSTVEVTRNLESAIDSLRPGFSGMEFDTTIFRPATFIEHALANLTNALVISAILVALLLGGLFYNWRTALISLLAVSISLLAALIMLHTRGETLNAVVLAGLVVALSIVIDEVVVDVEQVIMRLRENHTALEPRPVIEVIPEALGESRTAMLYGLLVTLLAVLPVFFIGGHTGILIRPLAVSYTFALLSAMAVALILTPALCIILLPYRSGTMRPSPLMLWLRKACDTLIARLIQRPALTAGLVAGFLVAGLAAIPFIRAGSVLPSFQEPYLMIEVEGMPSTTRLEMDRILSRIGSELRAVPGVTNAGAHVGRAVFGDQVVGINSAILWVQIDTKAEYDTTVAAIQQAVEGYSGMFRKVRTYLAGVLDQPEPVAANAVTLRIFGEDLSVLQEEAEKLRQSLSALDQVATSQVDLPVEEPAVEIEVDLDSAQRYGIKPGEVRRMAAVLFSGLSVGSLFEKQKVFDVVVWGEPELRDSLTDLSELPIDLPDGGYLRLGDVADIRVVASPTVIRREGISPYLDIVLTAKGPNTAILERDIRSALQGYTYPLEYHAEIINSGVEQQSNLQYLIISLAVALIGILLLLQAASHSWRFAVVALVTLPAALSGGVIAAALIGEKLSVLALLGLLAVLGISLRSTIRLVIHCQQIAQMEDIPFDSILIRRGAQEQNGRMAITTLAVTMVFLPFLLAGDLAGFEVVRATGILVLCGLATASIYNLFLLPMLYLRYGASREVEPGFQPAVQSGVTV